MASISLTIPDAVIPRIVAAVAVKFNYVLNQLPSETQGQFAKRMLAATLKQWVKDAEVIVPFVTAKATQQYIEQDVDANVPIT